MLPRHLGTAHAAKVLNNIAFWHLASPAAPGRRGRPQHLAHRLGRRAAKAAVTSFLDAIGYHTVDVGPLRPGGRRSQFGTPRSPPIGELSDQRGTAASVAAIRAALDAYSRPGHRLPGTECAYLAGHASIGLQRESATSGKADPA